MRILAIDTSCGAASVAVVESGRAGPLAVISRPMARGHAEALAPMVEEAMRGVEGGFPSLARIAVAVGPGSFTGIRVGLAMARAMGVALAIPVVGVSTLAAFAAPLLSEPRTGNHSVHNRRSTRLSLFSVVRGVRPSAGAASFRRAPGVCPSDWRRTRLVRRRRRRARRQRSAARRTALRPRRCASRARHCRSRSDGPRRRPLEESRAPRLRETARCAAKCGRAHCQGAGLSTRSSP